MFTGKRGESAKPLGEVADVIGYYDRGMVYKTVGQVRDAINDFEWSLELTDSSMQRELAEQQLHGLRGGRALAQEAVSLLPWKARQVICVSDDAIVE